MQMPWMHEPWLEQVGSMHWPSSTLHSAPFHPARHTHLPFSYTPFPLHSTGHESAGQNVHGLVPRTQEDARANTRWHVAAVTYYEGGPALLSQLGRRISKSSTCLLLFPSHTCTRTLICSFNHTHAQSGLSLALFQFSQAPPEPGYHGNPGIIENPPQTSPRSLWSGRENNREKGRLGERAFTFTKEVWKAALYRCKDGELCV